MKRVLLTLLGLVLVIGLFSAVGYAGYRLGLAQGAERIADGEPPRLRPFSEFGPQVPRMHDFEYRGALGRGFGGFPGPGFAFFLLFRLLFWVAILTLLFWLISWLFTRSGWRLVREASTAPEPPRPQNE